MCPRRTTGTKPFCGEMLLFSEKIAGYIATNVDQETIDHDYDHSCKSVVYMHHIKNGRKCVTSGR